jgi:predicted small lipoprotein YifL
MSKHWEGSFAAPHPGRALGLMLALALVALAGCATKEPFSYLDGERWTKSEMDTYDTVILAVDGKSYSYNDRIRVDPGVHHIAFQTRPSAGFSFSPRKELVLDVEPCTRYWFEAKRANAAQQDYEVRVNYKERIPGCGEGSDTAAASGSHTGY